MSCHYRLTIHVLLSFFVEMMLDFEKLLKGRILVFIAIIIVTYTVVDMILKSMKQNFEKHQREIDDLTSLTQGKASSII